MTRKRGGVILVPWVNEYPTDAVASLAAAEAYRWEIVVEDVGPPGIQHTNYHRILSDTWKQCARGGVDLMTVEHDNVIHGYVFEHFEECANAYCAFVYWQGASFGYGLGCTRWRARLIKAHPDLIDAAGIRWHQFPDGIPIDNSHLRLDTRIRDEARDRLLFTDGHPCLHDPPVGHLHNYAMPEPAYGGEQEALGKFRKEVTDAPAT